MKFILMNKNTPIALIEYDTNYNEIKKIYENYNIDYAPLSIINAIKDKSKNIVKVMNGLKDVEFHYGEKILKIFLKNLMLQLQKNCSTKLMLYHFQTNIG